LLGDDGQARSYLHGNHQGTIVAETDEGGALLSRSIAYPYGFPRYDSHGVPTYWYTGQERDRATGLSCHSARYLDMRVGRWVSADPLFGQLKRDMSPALAVESVSVFGYVSNQPLIMVDPDGQFPVMAIPFI